MAVIEYDEYKQKLLALEPTLGELEKALGIPKAREELAELQKETEQDGFWNDLEPVSYTHLTLPTSDLV